jgi:hypothetical protein
VHRSLKGGCANTTPTWRLNSTAETRRHAFGNFILSAHTHTHSKTMGKVRWHRSGIMHSGARRRPTGMSRLPAHLSRGTAASRIINQNQSMKSLSRRKQHRHHHCTYQYLTTTLHFCETMGGTMTPGLKILALNDSVPQSIRSDKSCKSGTASPRLFTNKHPFVRFPIFGTGTIDRIYGSSLSVIKKINRLHKQLPFLCTPHSRHLRRPPATSRAFCRPLLSTSLRQEPKSLAITIT